jgi:hypothetical protein
MNCEDTPIHEDTLLEPMMPIVENGEIVYVTKAEFSERYVKPVHEFDPKEADREYQRLAAAAWWTTEVLQGRHPAVAQADGDPGDESIWKTRN